MQWLRTLGSIMWDFMKMTMQFQSAGKVVLQGLCIGDSSVEQGHPFFKPSFIRQQGWILHLLFAKVCDSNDKN